VQFPKKPIILPCYDRRGCFLPSARLRADARRARRARPLHPALGIFRRAAASAACRQWIADRTRAYGPRRRSASAVMSPIAAQFGIGRRDPDAGFPLTFACAACLAQAERDQIRSARRRRRARRAQAKVKTIRSGGRARIRRHYARHASRASQPARHRIPAGDGVALLAVQDLAAKDVRSKTAAGSMADCRGSQISPQRDPWLILPAVFGVRSRRMSISPLRPPNATPGDHLARRGASDDRRRVPRWRRSGHLPDRQRGPAPHPAPVVNGAVPPSVERLAPQPAA